MKVKAITNNQPHFNGYVDKSVRKYVHRAIKNETEQIVKTAKENKLAVDEEEIFNLHAFGAKILNNLSDYMSKTHKNTKFTMGNTNYNSFPRLENPISSHIVRIYSPQDGKVCMDNSGEIAMPQMPSLNAVKNARDIDLIKLERYYNRLKNIDTKEIDKAFYNAEKEKMNEIPEQDLGFFAGIKRVFKEAKLESFLAKINEKIS